MRQSASMPRWGALLGAGALVTHELQYRASFGARADGVLAASGHAYLSWALALVTVLAALAVVRLVGEIERARRDGSSPTRGGRASLPMRWLGSSAALATVYLLQECLEGMVDATHPGIVGVLGTRHGWVALVAAVLIGGLIALLAGGADRIVARAACSGRRRTTLCRPPASASPSALVGAAPLDVLARHLAGRAPPQPCC